MRLIHLAAAIGILSSAAIAADTYPKGPGPAGRVNVANAAGFPTIDECKKALYAEIAAQANDPSKRLEAARNTPMKVFATNQARMTECREAGDSGKFRAFVKNPKPKT